MNTAAQVAIPQASSWTKLTRNLKTISLHEHHESAREQDYRPVDHDGRGPAQAHPESEQIQA